MKQISEEDYEKIQYLLGFVNNIAEMVLDPEEYLDPNTKDSTVYSVWCSEDDDTVELSTLEGDDVEEFKDTLIAIENEVKSVVKVDFTKRWEELRS